ncbi:LuxR C-terminal-related transcriptional regulator [Micromonospora sp. WMMD1102]|uniref:helix-turn-helix transcriptional regulator n=1 Tax=Micromonospora sp. WMMD1102 TaxID=3016105 RepID=UPI0024152B67|nr:LuxR C-terminal-related transcriptional regulator [Micromonospora sp. WMMD1102]MDG4790651.1 LuxR C-terminal-related transcriptional regulator [Micromonospora sp. WMMD1102]
MADLPPHAAEIAAEVERLAAAPVAAAERVAELFAVLRRLGPYDAAVVQVVDPERLRFDTVGAVGYDQATMTHLLGPRQYEEVELLGLDRDGPPLRVRESPVPVAELYSWSEHFAPAGFNEGIGVPLFGPAGRHIGVLALHTEATEHPTDAARDFLGLLAPVIGEAVDPMRSVAALARIVANATAGVVLTRAGNAAELAGLPDHPVLRPGSPVLRAAAGSLAEGEPHAAFLCPDHSGSPYRDLLRISVLACPDHVPAYLRAVVLVAPPGDLHGLTRRELEILGMLVEGWSNQRIADSLVIAHRTVAAHVEHILAKLAAPSRTLAAVRAFRLGLYVPRSLTRSAR